MTSSSSSSSTKATSNSNNGAGITCYVCDNSVVGSGCGNPGANYIQPCAAGYTFCQVMLNS